MDPRKREQPAVQTEDPTETEGPTVEQQDWDALAGAKILPDDVEVEDEADGELPEEDDDNAYQESDEALPDDVEEAVLSRDPSREGGRFDEE
ncbi:hypothetical protein LB524_04120 [Mesorhizobium sp. ESP6-5]|uniref:Uncharacterized protein n=1 Tax=Mesorhizobium australicum (strain HAMBI 3006 / LMG 24608 / WSM2073) TaxID=754035 RepID=L0KRK2_MESAW|nr:MULTISPECIES: hypothetical protein [Mesorhizobium]MBZ9932716.1 hypothetical protein [Mesorhizobium sp. BR1-1-5]AGB47736.1 hypothetical protein Mesau_05429 [Mesorhizobium australicum WSM2073]MBZ9682430.1 hypothetical protein [Mesorhizobium sp. CO1-1-2]MBZ9696954.1 hypothetical protein [Mesorhizobium sp. CO1-1-9]MBZ9722424.1 hypothetical protein [Mesorhizobium sp. CO1-1-11]